MQQTQDKESRLLELIDQESTDPVLEVSPEQYSRNDRRLLLMVPEKSC